MQFLYNTLRGLAIPTIEIFLIAIIVYSFISFFWNTRAMDLVWGILVFLFIFLLARWLNFTVLERLMYNFVNVAVIAILVIFQPELRLALSKLSVKGRRYEEMSEFDKFLDALSGAVYKMSEQRIGAIILLENQDSLEEYAARAVILNSRFSPELVEAIFASLSPLHDGAVIIRGTSVVAASVILPLADDTTQISRSMGTRHRAALGITQVSDAVGIVVSEESGKVSVARAGIMTRNVRPAHLKGILRTVFDPSAMETTSKMAPQEWIKTWKNF